MASTVLLHDKNDRKLLEWLHNTEVISKSEFNSWEKPEEGELIPILLNHRLKIDNNKWIQSAFKANPSFYHIPQLPSDESFQRTFSKVLRNNILNNYYVFPACKQGHCQWFNLLKFHPFSTDEFCSLAHLDKTTTFFNIISPQQFYYLPVILD